MAKMSMTRIRAFIAAVFAVIVLIVFIAFVCAAMGIRVPGLVNITNMFGFEVGQQ